jgi:ribose transport system permease protein
MSGDAVRDQPTSPAGVTPGGGAVPQEPRTAGGVSAGLRGRWANVEVRNLGLVAVLAVLVVVGTLTSDTFLTQANIENILVSSSVIGVVTVGVTLVIIGGGIDLSVGAIVALASVWATTVQTQSYGPVVMILCALTVGIVTGLVNGVLIAYGNLVPFIVTLAMLVSARGLAARIAQNRTQIVTDQTIINIATNDILGIPVLIWILAVVVALGWILLNRTTFGRRTIAIGGNAEAARLAGIDVRRTTTLLYVISGLCCGIAAVMIMARTTTGSSTHGELYELDAIAAAIIGGTLLSGGRGTIVGSLLGVIIFATITNLFAINGLSIEAQNMVKGGIIVAAVLIQQFKFKSVTRLLARNRVTTAT